MKQAKKSEFAAVVLCDGQVHEIHDTIDSAREARLEYERSGWREKTSHVWEVQSMSRDSAEEAKRSRRRIR